MESRQRNGAEPVLPGAVEGIIVRPAHGRTPPRQCLGTQGREVEAEQAVKPGAGQDRAGCFQAGQPEGDALTSRRPPGEQSACQAGAGPRTPEHHRRVILRALGSAPDQGKPDGVSDSSIEAEPPIEKSDRCPYGQRFKFRRPDGRSVVREMPCNRLTCEVCGPRLRRAKAQAWGHAIGRDPVFYLTTTEASYPRRRRQLVRDGFEVAQVTTSDGTVHVLTSAPVGKRVTGIVGMLTGWFDEAMEGRNPTISGSRGPTVKQPDRPRSGWLGVVADLEDEQAAKREPWECRGRVTRSLEHVAIVATELGVLVGRTDDTVVIEELDPALELRFDALIGLRRQRMARAA
jgi:hypothetical protein